MQGDRVGVATALSPATVGHFKFLFHLLFVGLGLIHIREVKPDTVVLDFNHPLAGKTLKFEVKVVGIEQSPH